MNLKNDIKALIRRVISEEVTEVEHDLSHSHPSEINPPEAWAGGENLVSTIDHAEADGSRPVVDEPEVIDHNTGDVVKISDRQTSLEEARLRKVISNIIKEYV